MACRFATKSFLISHFSFSISHFSFLIDSVDTHKTPVNGWHFPQGQHRAAVYQSLCGHSSFLISHFSFPQPLFGVEDGLAVIESEFEEVIGGCTDNLSGADALSLTHIHPSEVAIYGDV